MAEDRPWLSVVTVVKDDADGLRASVASLADQDRLGVEHLVIDSSADRDLIRTELAPWSAYQWCEPLGIYPAMNTGLAQAQGRYVYFLNAGDTLLPDVLARVHSALVAEPAWAFGRVLFTTPDGRSMDEPAWDYATERRHFLARRRFPPHQGVIMGTELLRAQGGFDETYRIAADYLAVLRAGTTAEPLALGFPLARFTTGGTSTTRWRQSLSEFHRARRQALDLDGWAGLHERLHTADTWLRTAVYRGVINR